MPANACIYIQQGNVDLSKIFEGVESNKRLFREPTWYDVRLGDDTVRFNVMDQRQVQSHVDGLLGYIASLDQDEARKRDASFAISHTTVVIGLVTDKTFEENHAIWQSLFRIADIYDGFVFAKHSVLLPNGAVLVGPLLESGAAKADDYFAESFHNESGRHAILQLEGSVAYLYLTAADSQKPEKDVAVFSTGELVEPEVAVASAKEGEPPPLVARYASDSAVHSAETFWQLKLSWSEDGNAVAVFLKGTPIAYVSAHEKSGRSKALSLASFFGEPWSDDSYAAAFPG